MPSSNSVSLNDVLFTGPKLQRVNVLTRFRRHAYVFTTDVVKMYRQIYIRQQDRSIQHILWRYSPDESVREYQLNTITYSLSSSPYFAIRCLRQLAEDHQSEHPLASRSLIFNIYVDDILTGASTIKHAEDLKQDLIQLLGWANFCLNKLAPNV